MNEFWRILYRGHAYKNSHSWYYHQDQENKVHLLSPHDRVYIIKPTTTISKIPYRIQKRLQNMKLIPPNLKRYQKPQKRGEKF